MKILNLLWNMAYRILILGIFFYLCYFAFIPDPTNEQIMDGIFLGICLLMARINDIEERMKGEGE